MQDVKLIAPEKEIITTGQKRQGKRVYGQDRRRSR